MSTWSQEDHDTAVRYWLQGLSGTMIAEKLTVKRSRNAVIGRMWRTGLHRDEASLPTRATYGSISTKRASKARSPKPPKLRSKPFGPPRGKPVPAADADLSHAKPWTERARHGECCFPVGTPVGDEVQLACCAPAIARSTGSAYCDAHHAVMFERPRQFNQADEKRKAEHFHIRDARPHYDPVEGVAA
jgi:hypothetical protein